MTDQRRAGGQGRSRRAGGRGSASTRGGGRSAAPKTKKNITPLTLTLEPPDIQSFAEFDLGDEIQASIAGMGITKPTPIQALAIEPVLQGKDVIAKAETGTGKTLAFGAPMMAKVDPSRSTVLGLVLSPTRELAEQVHDVLKELGAARGVKTTLIVGGEQMGPQVRALQAGAQVVVGTPGRVLDLLNQRFLQFPWTEFAILDEADKMLEIGFIDDVKKILDACNEYRQTLLFSATFPTPLLELARGYTSDPAEIATASGVATVETIHQYFLRCSEEDRARELGNLIEDSAEDDVFLVFCERRTDVDQLMRKLERRRFSVKALHGGYDQAARFRVMGAFRTGEVKCLVATDVASRGLDVKHVTHVVNLGVPRDVSDYTHRIGRTGRAGAHGVAVTFISRRDERDWDSMRRQSGFDLREISRPRELYSVERKRLSEKDDAKDVEATVVETKDATVESDERPRREPKPRRGREERDESKSASRETEERPVRGRRRRAESGGSDRTIETGSKDNGSREPEAKAVEGERPRRPRPRRDESERPKAEAKSDEGERPRRRRRGRSGEDAKGESERTPRAKRPEREERPESQERPEREERRPRRGRREEEPKAEESQNSKPRGEREERPERGERRPRRSRREEEPKAEESQHSKPRGEREERPERGERRPRRGRREEEPKAEPPRDRKPREERPRAEKPSAAEPAKPVKAANEPAPSGFGAGLAGGSKNDSASEGGRPRRKRSGRGRDSSGKAEPERPKREARRDDERADPRPAADESPSTTGGFGTGL